MSNKKILAILGGLIGLLIVILAFIVPALGWWEVSFDPFIGSIRHSYIDPIGIARNTANDNFDYMGTYFTVAGVVFLAGCVWVLVGAIKESKVFTLLCAILMIAGLSIFCVALAMNEDFENIISGLDFLYGGEHNVFFGSVSFLGNEWIWRLGNGWFICLIAAILAFIGAFYVDK